MGIFLGKWWILGATFGATEAKQRSNNVMTLDSGFWILDSDPKSYSFGGQGHNLSGLILL